jgi:hypothetical protein
VNLHYRRIEAVWRNLLLDPKHDVVASASIIIAQVMVQTDLGDVARL